MNPYSRRSKTPAKLADSTQQRLNMYALAAGAAGIGVLALSQSAAAKIVYTPANLKIVQNGGLITFDLNHDGVADFGLSDKFSSVSSKWFDFLRAKPTKQANEIWGAACSFSSRELCAGALPKGTQIGPKGRFQKDYPAGEFMYGLNIDSYRYGAWRNVTRYLGLKFLIKGKIHFGWARVKVSRNDLPPYVRAVVTGYAYETIPGKAIIAGATKGPDDDAQPVPATHTSPTPEPATLGMLALGAPGLSIWRREDPVAATSDRN